MKAQTLAERKHNCAGYLRFFSDEKNFIQDRKMHLKNDRWFCQHVSDVLIVMHTKFPASVMVLVVVSSEEDVTMPHFVEKCIRVNAESYINILETVVQP